MGGEREVASSDVVLDMSESFVRAANARAADGLAQQQQQQRDDDDDDDETTIVWSSLKKKKKKKNKAKPQPASPERLPSSPEKSEDYEHSSTEDDEGSDAGT